MGASEGESGELAPVLVEPRFVTSLVFFFILLGAFWKVRRMKFVQRGRQKRNLLGRGHQQHPQRTRIWIVRAIVRVIRALWWCIKALCRLPRLLLGALADVAAAITISAPQLRSQHLAIEDDFAAAIRRPLLQILNEDSLMQGSANIMASFDKINHPIECDSVCSSPIHYEQRYAVVSGSGENNEQHLQFKPYSSLEHGGVRLINSTSLSQIDEICQCKIVESRYKQLLYKVIADNSDLLERTDMSSPKMSIAMATLVLGLLAAPCPTAVSVKTRGSNCPEPCGSNYSIPYGFSFVFQNTYGSGYNSSDDSIPYPFGIGPECSLPGFNLTCAKGANNTSNLLLGNPSIKVLGFDMLWFNNFSFVPIVLTSIGYFVELAPAQNYSVHWEAPGRPFAISGSSNMSLFVVGCGFKVAFTGDSGVEVGNCSVICVGDQIMNRLPEGLCIGIGCCRIDITVPLRAFTLNISRTGQSTRLLEQVNAFITYYNQQSYGGPYQFQPSDLESDLTGKEYPVDLIWDIPYQPNCKRAMEDKASYACASNHSICQEAPIGGYVCKCADGFYGNPYVVNGCVSRPGPPPPVYDSMQPKANCPTSCGNVSFAFPFGTGVGCFAKLELYLACNPGPSAPILRLPDNSVVTDISIDQGTMRVLKSSDPDNSLGRMDSTLYAFSNEWGVLKWAVDSISCKDAKASKEGYRCFSHSDCVDVTGDKPSEQLGYRCKCSPGFEGNPYLKDGCTDINECLQPDKYTCNGICQNTFGNYTCTACPRGTDFNDITRKCKPSTIILGVTIGLSSGGGILFLAAVIYILTRRWKRSVQKRFRKRYFRKNKGILLEQLISSDESASDGTKIFSLEELEKATNNFDHTRVVGRGGHGTVYKGILSDQRVVAIKRSQVEASSEIEQFINEVSILSQINHRNVVKLHGCCLEVEVPLLVYEFISNGTLYDLLHHEQNGILLPLPWEERLRIAVEIAGALTYLHSAASVSILHRDVKSMNVLLNDSYIAKVSDFGASRSIPIDQTHLVTAVQGTFGYLDPEYYHTGQLNEKSDVYSFGVILLELLTRKKPIFENENDEKQNLTNYFLWAKEERPLEGVVDRQILGEASEEAIASVAGLAEECLSLTRGDRPTMKDVEIRLQMLRGRQSVAPPRDGERFSGLGGALLVPADHHGSRQYSLEQEFLSSSRVPR